MKNKLIKITKISILLILLMSTKLNAANLNLSTDLQETKENDEIIVKVETDKNIETATFCLKYDNSKLEFIEKLSEKVYIKDYPEEGILKVVYLDTDLIGEKSVNFKFKVKSTKQQEDKTEIEINDLTMKFVEDVNIYTDENLEQSTFNTSINIKRKILITPGIMYGLVIIVILLVLLIIIRKVIKKEKRI